MKNLILTLFIALPLVSFSQKIVAEIDGEKITSEELNTVYADRLLYPSHKKISKEGVLQDIINRRIAKKAAAKEKLNEDRIIKERIDSILHDELINKNLSDKFEKIKITDAEVKKYYKSHPEYKTSHVLFRVKAIPTKKELEKAYEFMYKVYKEIEKVPSKFEEVAKKYSQISTNESGGNIGYLPHTSMAPEYYEAIKNKKIGFISQPVRTQFGYHIIKVTGQKDYKSIDKNLYKRIIFDQKRDQIVQDYYASLGKGAKIKIYKKNL